MFYICQGWRILAYLQAIQYQYNTGSLVLQYNTIPIPMQYQTGRPAYCKMNVNKIKKLIYMVKYVYFVELFTFQVIASSALLCYGHWSCFSKNFISSTLCFWMCGARNSKIMLVMAHFFIVLLSIGYCSFSKK